jgi:hypothetical protein
MIKVCLFVLIFSLINCDEGITKILIGNNLFENILHIIGKQAIDKINEKKIENLEYEYKVFGELEIYKIELENMKHENITFREDEFIITYNDNQINVKVNNLNIKLESDFYSKFVIFPKSKGKIQLDMNIDLDIRLNLNYDKELLLSLSSSDLIINFNKFDIQGDFMIKAFSNLIKNRLIKSVINKMMNKIVLKKIESLLVLLNQNIQKEIYIPMLDASLKLKMSNPIVKTDKYFQIDLGLNITSSDRFLEKGVFKRDIFQNRLSDQSDQIKIMIDENLLNSGFKILYTKNRNFNLTSQTIPSNIPFKLNTYYLSKVIPELYNQYPNQELILYVTLESYPMIKLINNTFLANWNVYIEFALLNNPNEIILSVSNEIVTDFILSDKEDSKIHFKIKDIKFESMAVVQGDLQVDELRTNFNLLFSTLDYFINNYIEIYGIPIPLVAGINISSMIIKVEDQFLSITVTPDYLKTKFNWIK